jgi:hypothetical protein
MSTVSDGSFSIVDEDILIVIFSYLSIPDILSVRRVRQCFILPVIYDPPTL